MDGPHEHRVLSRGSDQRDTLRQRSRVARLPVALHLRERLCQYFMLLLLVCGGVFELVCARWLTRFETHRTADEDAANATAVKRVGFFFALDYFVLLYTVARTFIPDPFAAGGLSFLVFYCLWQTYRVFYFGRVCATVQDPRPRRAS